MKQTNKQEVLKFLKEYKEMRKITDPIVQKILDEGSKILWYKFKNNFWYKAPLDSLYEVFFWISSLKENQEQLKLVKQNKTEILSLLPSMKEDIELVYKSIFNPIEDPEN